MTAPVSAPSPVRASADDSRLATRANLEEAAAAFESIFTSMMMKSMRATSLGTDLLGSDASKTFRDMQDRKLSDEMGRRGTLGIAKAMTEFLSRNRPDLAEPANEPTP